MNEIPRDTVVSIVELLAIAIPLSFIIFLFILRVRESYTKYVVINSVFATINGLVVSFIVMLVGMHFGVEGKFLWTSTALGVILGIEIYHLEIYLLANWGVKWAKKLRYVRWFR